MEWQADPRESERAMAAANSSSPRSARSLSVMPQTVRSRTLPFHPHQSLSRIVRVARDIGVSESVADKYCYGARAAHLIVSAIIESDLRAGDTEAVAITVAPIYAAQEGADILPLAEALAAYDAADVAEDEAQLAVNRQCIAMLSDKDLDDHKRAAAKEAYAALRCVASYAQEQRDRKARAK